MGRGNCQKSKMARERNMEKQKAAKGSQLESNKRAMTIQVCMQTFICTTSELKCSEHAEAKHPKSDIEQKTRELQLDELKIMQLEEELVQEVSQNKLYAEKVSQLRANEKNLRLQLIADGEKFQQFQDTPLQSKEAFDKMAKSIEELKNENACLKSKSEKSDIAIRELDEELKCLRKQLEQSKNQRETLESLSRSL